MSRSCRVVLTTCIVVGLAGCGKAAAVFFDLPQNPDTLRAVEPVVTGAAGSGASSAAFSQDTVRAPLPIESTFDPDSVLVLLPRDPAGNVDWVAAIRDSVIDPSGLEPAAQAFGFDLVLKGESSMFDAYFPHSAHVEWLSCAGCHPRIFPSPGEPITMAQIGEGEACGRCHGPVAFPVETCERCHTNAEMTPGRIEAKLIGNVLFERGGDAGPGSSTPVAHFPHWVHRIRYRCSVCHPSPFSDVAGETSITMEDMQAGGSCGQCHGSGAAFGLFECTRCHDSEVAAEGSSP
jgi:c(7)-type cytochrome triheme protein